jgi:hypothetical protein
VHVALVTHPESGVQGVGLGDVERRRGRVLEDRYAEEELEVLLDAVPTAPPPA